MEKINIEVGTAKKTGVYNPLDFVSNSATRNEVSGKCPKCSKQMVTARISDPDDELHYCPTCRVSSPKEDGK